MRIIEKGTLQETEIRCEECGSVLAYTKGDIKTISLLRLGDLVDFKAVVCPVCGEYILIERVF